MNEQFINDLSKELAKLGTIHSVGEEWISYTGKIPSGGIPYCGQEVTRETYSALWSWVQAQGLVKTESEWQSIASSQNGNVPFYSSGNGTTTFRVPKLIGYVKGASSQAESGDYIKEGLPNVVGGLASIPYTSAETSGAFRLSNGIVYAAVQGGTDAAFTTATADFDASRSNPIYGRSLSVTPETSCVLFGVYAFGTVSNPSDLNVSNLASDINSIKTSYLPLSGGTMTGTVKFAVNSAIVRSTNDAVLNIFGGSAYQKGAQLSLFGESQADLPSGFRLIAYDGTTAKQLQGTKSGALTWGGKNVVRSVNGTNADASGNVTLAISSGTVSQKLKTTFSTSKDYAVNTTKSITGLTANKPVYLVICNGNASGVYCWISSGIDYSNMYDYSNASSEGYLQGSNSKYWVVIPTGTSISIVVRHHRDTPINLVAYQ